MTTMPPPRLDEPPLSYDTRPPRRLSAFTTAVLGAAILGGIGFAGGFFGPIIFTPEANQGPLLGIFITGPAGAVLGFVIGLIVGIVRKR